MVNVFDGVALGKQGAEVDCSDETSWLNIYVRSIYSLLEQTQPRI